MSAYKKVKKATTQVTKSNQTLSDVKKFPLCNKIADRGLRKSTLHHFGIREECDGVGLPIAHYFPVTYNTKIIGYIKRRLDIPKKHAWSVVGEVSEECDLLGYAQANQDGTKTLLVVEGFYDVLAAHQMVMDNTPEKYQSYINITSLVLGATKSVTNCRANEAFIEKHENFVTCFDNDVMTEEEKVKWPGAMRGKEATQAVGLAFKEAKMVEMSLKDPCEYLQADKGVDFRRIVAFEQKDIPYAHISRGIGLTAEEIMREPIPGRDIKCLPKLNNLLRGLRPYELTILMGPPKSGKALSVDTPVLTPQGFVPMRDIQAGSEVVGQDGLPKRVLGVYPQGKVESYEITFQDGSSVVCCGDHLWKVGVENNPYFMVFHTRLLLDHYKELRFYIPSVVQTPLVKSFPEWKEHSDRYITQIERVEAQEMQCISVDGSLFLVNDFIVTHNTTVARNIAYELRSLHDETVCYCSLEDTREQVAKSFVAIDNEVRVDKYLFDSSLVEEEDVKKTLETVLNPDKFIFLHTEDGAIRLKEIESLLKKAVEMGASFIIFDHFSYIIDSLSGGDGSSTKKSIDSLLTEVNNLTKRFPIHIIGINHVTIDQRLGIVVDKDTGQTEYPYWYRTSRYDGAGSKGFAKIADNIILIDMEYIDDEVVGRRQVKVGVNRRAVNTGKADIFTMNKDTGLLDISKEAF